MQNRGFKCWDGEGLALECPLIWPSLPLVSHKEEQKEGEFRGSRRVGVQLVLRERKECLRKLREQQVASALEEEAVSNWFVSQRYPPPPGHIWTHCRGRTIPGTQVRQARGRPSGQKQDAWWSFGGRRVPMWVWHTWRGRLLGRAAVCDAVGCGRRGGQVGSPDTNCDQLLIQRADTSRPILDCQPIVGRTK